MEVLYPLGFCCSLAPHELHEPQLTLVCPSNEGEMFLQYKGWPEAESYFTCTGSVSYLLSIVFERQSLESAVIFVRLQCPFVKHHVWYLQCVKLLKLVILEQLLPNQIPLRILHLSNNRNITFLLAPSLQPYSKSTCHRHRGLSFLDASQIQ